MYFDPSSTTCRYSLTIGPRMGEALIGNSGEKTI